MTHLPKIHKQDFIGAVAKSYIASGALLYAGLFVLVQYPRRDRNIRGIEHIAGQDNDSLNAVVLNQTLADLVLVIALSSSGQCAVCKQYHADAIQSEL